jgi:hypothetical protein
LKIHSKSEKQKIKVETHLGCTGSTALVMESVLGKAETESKFTVIVLFLKF